MYLCLTNLSNRMINMQLSISFYSKTIIKFLIFKLKFQNYQKLSELKISFINLILYFPLYSNIFNFYINIINIETI